MPTIYDYVYVFNKNPKVIIMNYLFVLREINNSSGNIVSSSARPVRSKVLNRRLCRRQWRFENVKRESKRK
jgi:hypothetical protein